MSATMSAFYSHLIDSNRHNSKLLFDTVSKLTQINQVVSCPQLTAQDFLLFFNDKVMDIRLQIPQSLQSDSLCAAAPSFSNGQGLSVFELPTLSELSKIVSSSRSTTCPLDPLPSWVIKELWSTLGPYVLSILNYSLSSGVFPACFKSAVVKPLLKKPGLDAEAPSNYRPVSNLAFLSKVFEKVVSKQLVHYLTENNLFEPLQSAFRANHSTETALTKVVNDLLLNADSDCASVLLLLDLSAVFDTVDHCILIERLEYHFGISGKVLSWLKSYLSERSQCVLFNNVLSEPCMVKHGVPQGSVLGPLLFSLYLAPLGKLLHSLEIDFHCYADDLQLYMPLTCENRPNLSKIEACLSAVRDWLSENFLFLNSAKTEMMIIGPQKLHNLFNNVSLSLDDCVV
uniref:Reverse transcriptase domain-containing protein n=1 Tax=Sphaeramia orbicularis TaxID=375764 RepID=A0A672ZWH4_9TELE